MCKRYAARMKLVFDSLWRAASYMLMPRIVWLSLLPLLVCAGLSALLGYFYWEAAVAAVRHALDAWAISHTVLGWMEGLGVEGLRTVLAPLIVVSLAVPVVVISSLLLVATWMSPLIARLVRERRFPELATRSDQPWLMTFAGSAALSLAALLAIVMTLPLWLIPPLAALIPPLIWGWLTAKVMSSEALAEYASRDERRRLMREHRWPLLVMGLVTGYLSAAPTLIWASAAALFFAPLLIPVAVWLYTLIFAFACLWFAHYCLAALQAQRQPLPARFQAKAWPDEPPTPPLL